MFVFSIEYEQGYLSIITMLLVVVIIQIFLGGTHWVYIPEVLNDAQFGFVLTFHYSNAILISLTLEYMIKYLGVQGTFLYFSFINFLGFCFIWAFLRETKGLSDKEKKELYIPSHLREEIQEPSAVELDETVTTEAIDKTVDSDSGEFEDIVFDDQSQKYK